MTWLEGGYRVETQHGPRALPHDTDGAILGVLIDAQSHVEVVLAHFRGDKFDRHNDLRGGGWRVQ